MIYFSHFINLHFYTVKQGRLIWCIQVDIYCDICICFSTVSFFSQLSYIYFKGTSAFSQTIRNTIQYVANRVTKGRSTIPPRKWSKYLLVLRAERDWNGKTPIWWTDRNRCRQNAEINPTPEAYQAHNRSWAQSIWSQQTGCQIRPDARKPFAQHVRALLVNICFHICTFP